MRLTGVNRDSRWGLSGRDHHIIQIHAFVATTCPTIPTTTAHTVPARGAPPRYLGAQQQTGAARGGDRGDGRVVVVIVRTRLSDAPTLTAAPVAHRLDLYGGAGAGTCAHFVGVSQWRHSVKRTVIYPSNTQIMPLFNLAVARVTVSVAVVAGVAKCWGCAGQGLQGRSRRSHFTHLRYLPTIHALLATSVIRLRIG